MDRQKLLLVVTAVLVIVRFVFMPVSEARQEKREEVESLNKRYVKGQALEQQLPELQQAVEKLNMQLIQLSQAYPKVQDNYDAQLQFQLQFQNIAGQYGLRLDNIKWLDTVPGTPEKARLELNLEGSFKKVVAFHLELENSGEWVRVQNLDLFVRKQNINYKELGNATGKIVIDVFYINQGAV